MALLLGFLLTAGLVLLIEKLPGIRVADFRTALWVAGVYALLTTFLKPLVVVLAIPLVIVTLGLFLFFINAFLLWLTDKFVSGFKIDGFFPLILATLAMTLGKLIIDQTLVPRILAVL